MPGNMLLRRLKIFANLKAEDEALISRLCHDVRRTRARRDIISEGERPEHIHLMVEGWAARYYVVPSGARQITALLIPGDFFDLHVTVLGQMDHGIVALTDCRLAYIDPAALDRATAENSRLARALWWSTLVDESVLRNWVVNVGRRDAYERIAHLLCELHARMKLVGLVTEEDELDLPLTQEEIADATGLTAVHTNRMLQLLRKQGLIALSSGRLHVLRVSALQKTAGFDPGYLHIARRAPCATRA